MATSDILDTETSTEEYWSYTIGGVDVEYFNGVIVDSTGHIYAVGCDKTSTRYSEALITKWAINGTLVWQKRVGGNSHNVFEDVTIDSNNNIYAVGQDINNPHSKSFITKWDVDGSLLWQKTLNGDNNIFLGTITDNSGNVYAVGKEWSSRKVSKAIITKWNSNGVLLWQRSVGNRYNVFHSVATDTNGNIYAVGYSEYSNINSESIITKWDQNGALLWQKSVGKNSDSKFYSVVVDLNNDVYAVGGEKPTNSSYIESTITKWNTNGDIIWQKSIGRNIDIEIFYGVVVDLNNDVYAVGNEHVIGNSKGLITKWDQNGALLWQKRSYNSRNDSFKGVAVDHTNNICAVGYGCDFDEKSEAFITKWDSSGSISNGVLFIDTEVMVNTTTLVSNNITLSINAVASSANTTTLPVNITTFTPKRLGIQTTGQENENI